MMLNRVLDETSEFGDYSHKFRTPDGMCLHQSGFLGGKPTFFPKERREFFVDLSNIV